MNAGLLTVLVFILAPCQSALAGAAPVPSYYGQDFAEKYSTLSSAELKRSLQKIFNSFHLKQEHGPDVLGDTCPAGATQSGACYHHTQNNYSTARSLVTTQLDLQKNARGHFIWEVYCDRPYTADDFPGGQGPGPTNPPNHDVLNIEHTWPQSLFSGSFSKELQKGDLHHLFPSDNRVNSQRGNHPFAEVAVETQNTDCPNTTKLGQPDSKLGLPSERDTYFEPPTHHRGNIARALFYFSVRYNMSIDPTQEYFLRKWNKEDPIDQAELERHQRIFALQGDRNPFIDLPQLVDQIKDF